MTEELANLGAVLNILSTEDLYGEAFHKVGQATDRSNLAMRELVPFLLSFSFFF